MNEKELKEFYDRFSKAYSSDSSAPGKALSAACYKDGKEVCKIWLDGAWFNLNSTKASRDIASFEGFKGLVEKGYIEVRPINLEENKQVEPGE